MLIGTGCSEVREGKSKASFLSRILGWGPTWIKARPDLDLLLGQSYSEWVNGGGESSIF